MADSPAVGVAEVVGAVGKSLQNSISRTYPRLMGPDLYSQNTTFVIVFV